MNPSTYRCFLFHLAFFAQFWYDECRTRLITAAHSISGEDRKNGVHGR